MVNPCNFYGIEVKFSKYTFGTNISMRAKFQFNPVKITEFCGRGWRIIKIAPRGQIVKGIFTNYEPSLSFDLKDIHSKFNVDKNVEILWERGMGESLQLPLGAKRLKGFIPITNVA